MRASQLCVRTLPAVLVGGAGGRPGILVTHGLGGFKQAAQCLDFSPGWDNHVVSAGFSDQACACSWWSLGRRQAARRWRWRGQGRGRAGSDPSTALVVCYPPSLYFGEAPHFRDGMSGRGPQDTGASSPAPPDSIGQSQRMTLHLPVTPRVGVCSVALKPGEETPVSTSLQEEGCAGGLPMPHAGHGVFAMSSPLKAAEAKGVL